MEARPFYFTVHSASNLVDVRNFGEMKVYAKVSIAGQSECTEVDLVNKTNPEWNTTLCFFVLEEDIVQEEVPAVIELFCRRSLSHDKYIGELNLTLRPFYKGECNFEVSRNDSNQNKSFGTLKFSLELGDKVLVTSVADPEF
ncbi:protein SRC2 homolog [Lycium barbarum]|uniref:protein SRC2 homolog n=1 Tax=Lycium barbarum TaxID=112863 RepID=UPI00293E9E8B|nr:protein SRC2 homolog [Lycium barbarum]